MRATPLIALAVVLSAAPCFSQEEPAEPELQVRVVLRIMEVIDPQAPADTRALLSDEAARMAKGRIAEIWRLEIMCDSGAEGTTTIGPAAPTGDPVADGPTATMQVAPEVGGDNYTIKLTISCQVTLPARKLALEIERALTLWDGKTSYEWLSSTQGPAKDDPDGKAMRPRYLAIQAVIVNPAGEPIRKEEAKPDK